MNFISETYALMFFFHASKGMFLLARAFLHVSLSVNNFNYAGQFCITENKRHKRFANVIGEESKLRQAKA